MDGSDGSGVCFGDSGGPLYVENDRGYAVAGIASRIRHDLAPGPCNGGGIHVRATAHDEWILRVAPEAAPNQSLGGGGGCSVGPVHGPQGFDAAMLLVVLFLASRRGARKTTAPAAIWAVSLLGCGSEPASLCIEQFDPTGSFCSAEYSLIDLRTADARARATIAGDAILIHVLSTGAGLMDPDGNAYSWELEYFFPSLSTDAQPLVESLGVSDTNMFSSGPGTRHIGLRCIPTQGITTLDSNRVIPDAVRRLEKTDHPVRLGETGFLSLEQRHPCLPSDAFRRNNVRYGPVTLVYDDDGQFLAMDFAEE